MPDASHLFLALNRRLYRQRFIDAFDRFTLRLGMVAVIGTPLWIGWKIIERIL